MRHRLLHRATRAQHSTPRESKEFGRLHPAKNTVQTPAHNPRFSAPKTTKRENFFHPATRINTALREQSHPATKDFCCNKNKSSAISKPSAQNAPTTEAEKSANARPAATVKKPPGRDGNPVSVRNFNREKFRLQSQRISDRDRSHHRRPRSWHNPMAQNMVNHSHRITLQPRHRSRLSRN